MTNAAEHQETPISADVRPDAIKRHVVRIGPLGGAEMLDVATLDGGNELNQVEYVRYDDHLRAVLNPMGHRLTKDDAALFSTLQFIIDNIAGLEQDESFAGFQFHRILNDEGALLQITLTPCDNLDGITAPRMVNEAAPRVNAARKPGLKLVDAKGGAL